MVADDQKQAKVTTASLWAHGRGREVSVAFGSSRPAFCRNPTRRAQPCSQPSLAEVPLPLSCPCSSSSDPS